MSFRLFPGDQPDYDWDQAHGRIIGETFDRMMPKEASALVVLLYCHNVVFRKELTEVVAKVEGFGPIKRPALELHAAATLVAALFGFDRDVLLKRARARLTEVRDSQLMRKLKLALEEHQWVERLEPVGGVP